MTTCRAIAATLIVLTPALSVLADDTPPPPPPQDTWIGKGQFGFLESHGNSDAESINGNIDMVRFDGPWKNEFYLAGLYGKSTGVVSAEREDGWEQTNYAISGDLFAFGGFRGEHDLFDGFQYQASVTTGLGYKIIDWKDTKLTAQLGVGYRQLRPEELTYDSNGDGAVISRTLQDRTSGGIGTAGLDFLHNFTPTTTLTNKFLVESGAANTMTHDEIALAVKMSTKLALSVGYAITNNSSPPPPLKKLDTLATVNLVFAF